MYLISQRWSLRAVYLMSHARSSGKTSSGKIFMQIAMKLSKKVASDSVLNIGMTKGMTTATAMLMSTTYETVSDRRPPSFPVITPAAAAVGQMKHSIAHSVNILRSPSGINVASQVNNMNMTIWKASAMKCQRRNLRSCGEILLNWRKSMIAMSAGWTRFAKIEKDGSTFDASQGT